MPEDARSSRYTVPPDCIHIRMTFGPKGRCRQRRCREWKDRVVAVLDAERSWAPGTGAELRAHRDVLEVI